MTHCAVKAGLPKLFALAVLQPTAAHAEAEGRPEEKYATFDGKQRTDKVDKRKCRIKNTYLSTKLFHRAKRWKRQRSGVGGGSRKMF